MNNLGLKMRVVTGLLIGLIGLFPEHVMADEPVRPAEETTPGSLTESVAPVVDQWADFPTGRTIEFSGYTWRVKGADAGQTYGPGGFPFGTTEESVWVDDAGRLHLRVYQDADGVWYSAEVRLTEALGHGDYRFTTAGRVDDLDPNLIFGLFLWEYTDRWAEHEDRNVANEFDIEFGTWRKPGRLPAQFVCQPWTHDGNRVGYDLELKSDDDLSTHAFRWLADRVECRAWLGGPNAESDREAQLVAWTYLGRDVPGGAPQTHLNLWCFKRPPARGEAQEVVIERFEFVPAGR